MHDPAALYAARTAIRSSYAAIQRLRAQHDDPWLAAQAETLNEQALALTRELDALEPELPLAVRHPVLVAIGGGRDRRMG